MKSTVSDNSCKAETAFPKLMIAETTGCIVLFESYGQGTCVSKGKSTNEIGYRGTLWAMGSFKDFTGSICLEN